MPREKQEKALSAPQKFVEKSKAMQIFELAVQNYGVQQIADKLGVTEERVRQIMAEETKRITIAMQDLRERHQTVTLARTEYIYQRLMEVFIAQLDAEPMHGPNKDLFKMIKDILVFQNEIVHPKNEVKAGDDNSKNLTIQQTFVAGSDFYDHALQEMQKEFLGYTVHKVDEAEIVDLSIEPDPRIVEIESLASKYLPDGAIPNDDESDDPDAEPTLEPAT